MKAGGNALIKAADTAAVVGRDFIAAHKFQSPLIFQFQQGRLYSGFPPADAVKLQQPIKRNVVIQNVIINDAIQAEYLRRSLVLQEVFTIDGKLAANVLEKAIPIRPVSEFTKAAPAYIEIEAKGNIKQWYKYSYRFELNLPHVVDGEIRSLKGEVHFYMNKVTKEVYYSRDYKIKLELPNQPTIKVEDLFAEVFKGVKFTP